MFRLLLSILLLGVLTSNGERIEGKLMFCGGHHAVKDSEVVIATTVITPFRRREERAACSWTASCEDPSQKIHLNCKRTSPNLNTLYVIIISELERKYMNNSQSSLEFYGRERTAFVTLLYLEDTFKFVIISDVYCVINCLHDVVSTFRPTVYSSNATTEGSTEPTTISTDEFTSLNYSKMSSTDPTTAYTDPITSVSHFTTSNDQPTTNNEATIAFTNSPTVSINYSIKHPTATSYDSTSDSTDLSSTSTEQPTSSSSTYHSTTFRNTTTTPTNSTTTSTYTSATYSVGSNTPLNDLTTISIDSTTTTLDSITTSNDLPTSSTDPTTAYSINASINPTPTNYP